MSAVAAPPEDERPPTPESTPDRAARLLEAFGERLRAESFHNPDVLLSRVWEEGDWLMRDQTAARRALDAVNDAKLWNMTAEEVLAAIPRAIEEVRK